MRRSFRFVLMLSMLLSLLSPLTETTVYAQTPTSDIGVTVVFSPETIAQKGVARLTITITNANASDLTSAAFNASLPAGLELDDPVSLNNTCGGTGTANIGETTFSLSGGTVPAGGSCVFAVNIGATAPGNPEFSLAAGAITGDLDGTFSSNDTGDSAVLNVANFDFNAEINKQFNPLSILPGNIATMSVSIYNSNTFQLENASWTDTLPTGLYIADTPNVTTSDCGSSIIVADTLSSYSLPGGSTTLTIRNATVPAKVGSTNGECKITVDVTSTASKQNLINTIPGGELDATGNGGADSVSNTDEAKATLTILSIDTPSISKGFSPNTIWVGQSSRLTINIHNDDTQYGITEVSLTDTLPANVVLANPVTPTMTNCGSSPSLTATTGTDTITISNASIAADSTCAIQVYVTSTVQGTYTNTIPIGAISSHQGVTNDAIAQDDLAVQALSISKVFSPDTMLAGDESTLTITIRNPSSTPYTGTTLTDTLPNVTGGNNLFYTGTPTTTCAGGTVLISTTNNTDDTITLSGATIPAGTYSSMGSCTITATVTTLDTALSRNHDNTIAANTMDNDQHVSNPMSATDRITITAQSITVNKTFSPNAVQQNGTTTVTLQLRNPTSSILHVTNFTDEFPSGMVPNGAATTTCANGEASTVDLGSGLYSLVLGAATPPGTGAEIPAGTVSSPGTCTVSVPVSMANSGTYTNSVPDHTITTVEGITNLYSTSRNISVYETGKGLTGAKAFSSSYVAAGSSVRLRISLTAPADMAITGLTVTDHLPANMVITNSTPASTSCSGGTVTAVTGSDTITLSGATIAASTSCNVDVYVTSDVSGTYTNTIYADTDISNDQNQTFPSNRAATVTFSHLTMSKAFYPDIVAPNGRSTLTVTLRNDNTAALINVNLTDYLTSMGTGLVYVASPANTSTTCGGGTVTAASGSQQFTLTNGVIPAQVSGVAGICTVSVDVIASGTFATLPVTLTNTVLRTNVSGVISGVGTTIQPVANAPANLIVKPLTIGVVKGFNPLTVFGGSSSTMTITLINENTTYLTGIAFSDTMPTGMYLANPVNANTGTCGGTITATPGAQSFSYSGGTLASNKQCSLTLSATMNVHGNRTNTIPVGAVTTFNGAANTQPASASLTNLPGASITKFFTPNEITLGDAVLLTIQLKNTGNIALSNVGFTDTLPSGVTIASSPAPTNGCNGVLTATAGTGVIQLGAGSIAAGPDTTCDIVVPIDASGAGVYTNTIAKGAITSAEGATNTEPAEDTLTVHANPSLQLVKAFIPGSPPYDPGETLNYTLTATNTGDIDLTNVTISDPSVTLGTCTPAQPATLAPDESIVCAASHVVTAGDVSTGTYTNTATADSNETEPVTDTVIVPLTAGPALGINKVLNTAGPYSLGDLLTYQITATNIGTVDLTGVTISDPDVTLGTCTPTQPADLAVGESMVCAGTYTIAQADVDAGTFTNIATADSNETSPVTDSVTIPVEENARLDIYKQVTSTGPYDTAGDVVTYDISAVNNGDQTLTGVTITDPDAGVTMGACTPSQPATLATGEILSCAATHIITAADITNGGYSNTAYADSNETDQVSDTAEVITQIPEITLDKTGAWSDTDGSGDRSAGDYINYTFTITNSGEVTLTNVYLIDIVGGVTIVGSPIATLNPSDVDSTSYTGYYVLTQADVDAGTYTNTASVVGTPPVGSDVSDTDNDTQTLAPNPSISLVKTGTVHEDTVNQTGSVPVTRAEPGDTITYTFRVENTGNVTLSNITLSDTVGGVTISGGPIASLAPGGVDTTTFTGTYTLTQSDIDDGHFPNTATVTADTPSGGTTDNTGSEDKNIPEHPSIALEKTGVQNEGTNGHIDAGETITYTFKITNTGNVTLDNVDVSDLPLTISGGPISLAPGEENSTSITGTYTVTQTDIDSCQYDNEATVSGDSPQSTNVSNNDDFTVTFTTVPTIEVTINDTLDTTVAGTVPGQVDAGDWINYTYTITNTGNVTLTDIDLTGLVSGVTLNGSTIASLAPGASDTTTYYGHHVLTQAEVDAGTFHNEVQVDSVAPTCVAATPSNTGFSDTALTDAPSIELIKSSLVDMTVTGASLVADPGDVINYSFRVTNTGNVTLTDITLSDSSITVNGGPIASLDPGEVDTTTFTGSHTLTQADIDAGHYENTATVTGTPPVGVDVTDDDTVDTTLAESALIGVAKRVVGDPAKVSAGVWDITYEILVRNYGNVTLSDVQVTDDLATTFPTGTFSVQSISSAGTPPSLTVNAAYDGTTDTNLLDGTDSLAFGEEGTLTLVVRYTPTEHGPFNNAAVGSAQPPTGGPATDISQNGNNPDSDNDGNPTNNNEPTPVDFGYSLFDPPYGMKVFDASGLPLLRWTMVWINNTNTVAIDAQISDPIPAGTTYQATGAASGTGVAPASAGIAGSTDVGVSCTSDGTTAIPTVTDYCYYEGPTATYTRGRIVWIGSLGPDLGVTDPAVAENDLTIVFDVRVNNGISQAYNHATIDADLNGDGVYESPELEVDQANSTWAVGPGVLPITGFTPGERTDLSVEPFVNYQAEDDLVLEIPKIGVKAPIVGVPITDGQWNLAWLGNNVGYLESTAFPTWNGNSALTAHNYDFNGNPGVFAHLEDMRWGDTIIINGWGKQYVYEVRTVQTRVAPNDVDVITHEDNSWITLITCRGYDEASDTYKWRVVVRAVLISEK